MDKRKFRTILNWIALTSAGLVTIGAAFYYQMTRPHYVMDEIELRASELRSQIATLKVQYATIQETLDAATNDPNALATVGFQAEIRRISTELKSLRDALGSDIERTLSVPLLRKDVQKIEEQLEEGTTAASKEIDRIYDQNKWFLGLMGTMAVGLFGLAISNLLQTRRKDVNV